MKRYNWIVFAPFYLLVVIVFLGIAQMGSKTVTTIKQQQPVERKHHIVIDAGHGGVDGGATSCSGNKESEDSISSDDKDDGGSLSSADEGVSDKNNESCMSAISAGTILFNAGIIIAAVCLFFKSIGNKGKS